MSRVLLAISDDTYVRNYLRSPALSDIRSKHELLIIASDKISLRDEVMADPVFRGFCKVDPRDEDLHQLYFNLLMWRNRKKSRTFFYRWLRNSNWQLIRRTGSRFGRAFSYLQWFIAAAINPRGLRIPLLGNGIVFPLVSRIVRRSLKVSPSLRDLVSAQDADVIVFPSAAFDPLTVDLVVIAKELGIPSVCLVDNWDNLTSKTIFWNRPDHIAVWGPQTKEQAIDVHGFDPTQVHMIGTPRFDAYFETRTSPVKKVPYPNPYVLFVGSAMPFDEIGVLRKLDQFILENSGRYHDLQVVYRPHPWQQKRTTPVEFFEDDFSRVLLDHQIRAGIETGVKPENNDPAFQPDLSYYPGLLRGAQVVIGPLTTMLLEASLCLRPVVALSYFDGHHANTTKRYFSHFDGMENVPGFSFCENPNELSQLLEVALSSGEVIEQSSDEATSYFLYRDNHSYGQRLLNLVEIALNAPNTPSMRNKP